MTWPSTLVSYKRTDTYDQDTIPLPLLAPHTTEEGVWAMVRVLEGQIELVTGERVEILSRKNPGLLEPVVSYHLRVTGDVQLYVDFFHEPASI